MFRGLGFRVSLECRHLAVGLLIFYAAGSKPKTSRLDTPFSARRNHQKRRPGHAAALEREKSEQLQGHLTSANRARQRFRSFGKTGTYALPPAAVKRDLACSSTTASTETTVTTGLNPHTYRSWNDFTHLP